MHKTLEQSTEPFPFPDILYPEDLPVSARRNEIAEAIMTQVPRGVTFLEAQGGYSKEPTKVITCIARQHESAKIFRLVRSIDPDAFVSQSKVRGVFGQGFDSIKEKA